MSPTSPPGRFPRLNLLLQLARPHAGSLVIDADTIIVLEAGRIRASGQHRELLQTDSLYRELVEALRIAHLGS